MLKDVAKPLHTFFVPQMEQFGLCEQAARHGSLSTLNSEVGRGVLWALAGKFSELTPALSRLPSGSMRCTAKVNEILSMVTDAALASMEEGSPTEVNYVDAPSIRTGINSSEDAAIAQAAKRIIDTRFNEKLATSQLSKELFVGRTHLCEAFQDAYSMSIGAYLRARRMEEAAELLISTDLTVSHIAKAVGYAHASSFIEAYRRYYGTSPPYARTAL